MDKFWERGKTQKLTQKEIVNLKKCISSKETELVILNLSTKKIQMPDDFLSNIRIKIHIVEFYQTLRKK